MIRQDVSDGARFGAAWIFGIVLCAIAVVAGFVLWAGLAPWQAKYQNDVNHNSPGYYSAKIAQLQSDMRQYNQVDPKSDQAKYYVGDFCANYTDPAVQGNANNPSNVVAFASQHC